jgi:hydrogenase maturation protein HypF
MIDNELKGDRPVIGVSFDGTGYGDDGAIWGGEFLIADYQGYQRFAHLEYLPLPGGDSATRKPYRIALAQLMHNGIDWDEDLPPVIAACGDDLSMLRSMLENKINSPMTSSVGRLFDAVSALSGVRGEINYEAQAAIEFEAFADPEEQSAYDFGIMKRESGIQEDVSGTSILTIVTRTMYNEVISDLRAQTPVTTIAARFHNGLANIIVEVCQAARGRFRIDEVALSGGVWQNMTLLAKTVPLLERSKFKVYIHRKVPANDGGLALGQAIIAGKTFEG